MCVLLFYKVGHSFRRRVAYVTLSCSDIDRSMNKDETEWGQHEVVYGRLAYTYSLNMYAGPELEPACSMPSWGQFM